MKDHGRLNPAAHRGPARSRRTRRRRPQPGFTFRLEGHEIEALNREYLVTEVLHEGRQPQELQEHSGGGGSGYSNRFRAVPSEVALRPELRTRKPTIRGVQTAIRGAGFYYPSNYRMHR